jgi:hypothetical protein
MMFHEEDIVSKKMPSITNKKKETGRRQSPKKKTKRERTPEPPEVEDVVAMNRASERAVTDDEAVVEFDDWQEEDGSAVGHRVEVEFAKRWYVGTVIASRPKENLALVFYDFDQNIGTIDFPKLKRDTRFVKKEQRWTKRLVESVIKNDLKIKSKEEMEKRWERALGEINGNDGDDESDDEDGGDGEDDDDDDEREKIEEVYDTQSKDGSWRWPTPTEAFEMKMVKAGATEKKEGFVLTAMKFTKKADEDKGEDGAGAVFCSLGACVKVGKMLVRIDEINAKGQFRGVRVLTRTECRTEWVGKHIDVLPKQNLKPHEIRGMADDEQDECETFLTVDDVGFIDIDEIVEVINARHHLVQALKKRTLEDQVFVKRIVTRKFINKANAKHEVDLEAKVFNVKKVKILRTFASDENTLMEEKKKVLESSINTNNFCENNKETKAGSSSARAKKGSIKTTTTTTIATTTTSAKRKKPPPPSSSEEPPGPQKKKKAAEEKEEEEDDEEEKQPSSSLVQTTTTTKKKIATTKEEEKKKDSVAIAVAVAGEEEVVVAEDVKSAQRAASPAPAIKKKKGIEVIDFIVPEEQRKKLEQQSNNNAKKRQREREQKEEEERNKLDEETNAGTAAAATAEAAAAAQETKTPQYKRPSIAQRPPPSTGGGGGGGGGFSIPKATDFQNTPSFQQTTAPPPPLPHPAAEKLEASISELRRVYENWPNFEYRNGGKKMTLLFGPDILIHPLNHRAQRCMICDKVGHFKKDCPLARQQHNNKGGGMGGGGGGARAKGVCFAYQRGECTRGGNCQFSHAPTTKDDRRGGGEGGIVGGRRKVTICYSCGKPGHEKATCPNRESMNGLLM